MKPIVLGPNQPAARPYRGGAGIAQFRGTVQPSEFSPEDFVASTTEVFGGGAGLTVLPDGRTLRAAIEEDPAAYLGADHIDRFGADPSLLVKLLHTGERLFVHFHPDAAFAREHFDLSRGKTEAWVIVATSGDSYAHLGFNREVSAAEVQRWFDHQDVPSMLAAMNRVTVRAGDTLFVPATLPHAIGPGITLVELQEPVDLSILLEYRGFDALTERSATLGLDARVALGDLDRRAWDAGQLATLSASRPARSSGASADPGSTEPESAAPESTGRAGTVTPLFPDAADAYFRADRVRVADAPIRLDAGFCVLVVVAGSGALTTADGTLELAAGMTVLVPFGAGPAMLSGVLETIRCMPPVAPAAST